jgi:hypothetical protein
LIRHKEHRSVAHSLVLTDFLAPLQKFVTLSDAWTRDNCRSQWAMTRVFHRHSRQSSSSAVAN